MIKFFYNMSKYIDGVVTFTFEVLIDTLSYLANGSPTENVESNYPKYTQIKASKFITEFSD